MRICKIWSTLSNNHYLISCTLIHIHIFLWSHQNLLFPFKNNKYLWCANSLTMLRDFGWRCPYKKSDQTDTLSSRWYILSLMEGPLWLLDIDASSKSLSGLSIWGFWRAPSYNSKGSISIPHFTCIKWPISHDQ